MLDLELLAGSLFDLFLNSEDGSDIPPETLSFRTQETVLRTSEPTNLLMSCNPVQVLQHFWQMCVANCIIIQAPSVSHASSSIDTAV